MLFGRVVKLAQISTCPVWCLKWLPCISFYFTTFSLSLGTYLWGNLWLLPWPRTNLHFWRSFLDAGTTLSFCGGGFLPLVFCSMRSCPQSSSYFPCRSSLSLGSYTGAGLIPALSAPLHTIFQFSPAFLTPQNSLNPPKCLGCSLSSRNSSIQLYSPLEFFSHCFYWL